MYVRPSHLDSGRRQAAVLQDAGDQRCGSNSSMWLAHEPKVTIGNYLASYLVRVAAEATANKSAEPVPHRRENGSYLSD